MKYAGVQRGYIPFQALKRYRIPFSNLERIGLLKKLPKQPGRKEHRYGHLLGGEQGIETEDEITLLDALEKTADREDHLNSLKDEITMLREELSYLKKEFETFKAQFG